MMVMLFVCVGGVRSSFSGIFWEMWSWGFFVDWGSDFIVGFVF